MNNLTSSRRWLAFYLICLGDFMIVLDISIVNVALPAIKAALSFSDTHLAWIVNAYMLTYSGLLLLGGRLGDLYGQKRIYLAGLAIFIIASLVCGIAHQQSLLIFARAVQGIGGAVISAVAFSFILVLFTDSSERIKAMGIFGFIMAGGGAVGVFLGGVITDLLGWHWIFLINVPVGLLALGWSAMVLPPSPTADKEVKLDGVGSLLITVSMLIFVYAIINANEYGWASAKMAWLCGIALLLAGLFVAWEWRYPQPILPLSIFKVRNISLGMVIGALWSSGMFAAFFMISLNLQEILHYSPMQIGLAFLPADILMAVVSIFLSGKCIAAWGSRYALTVGLMLVTGSMILFAITPAQASFMSFVLPAMLLFGAGGGIAMNPMLYASTAFVPADENGLASGILNATFSIGGTLGLSLLVSLSSLVYQQKIAQGIVPIMARLESFHWAYWFCALMVGAGAVLALQMQEPAKDLGATPMPH